MKQITVKDRSGKDVELLIDLGYEDVRYTPRSRNSKTGDIPNQWVGSSYTMSEGTCSMCPLMQSRVCYAQQGTPKIGFSALLKSSNKGDDKTLDNAIAKKAKTAQTVRFGAIGDPGSINTAVYKDHEEKAREAGLKVLSYTHQWYLEHAKHLKGHALASADNMTDVKDALADGWRVAVHVDKDAELFNGKSIEQAPQGKIDGKKYFLCPAQREGNKVDCNHCQLCDGTKRTNVDVIVFIEHGMAMKSRKGAK